MGTILNQLEKKQSGDIDRLLCAAVMAAAGAWILGGSVEALTAAMPAPVPPPGAFHPGFAVQMKPEPGENLTYMAMCLFAPFIAWGAAALAAKLPDKAAGRGGWIGWALAVLFLWGVAGGEFSDMLFDPALKYIWIAFPLGAAAAAWPKLHFSFRARRVAGVLMLLLPVVQVLFSRIYTGHNLHTLFTHHLDIIAYAVSQAAAGGGDYHQYGFYARMLAPLFRLTGTGVTAISLVMGALYLIAFWALFRSAIRYGGGFFTFGAALTLFIAGSWSMLNDDFFDPYFAYYPIRFFFPALGTALFMYGERRKTPAVRSEVWYGIFAGAAFFWNPDSGIAVIGAFTFMMLYALVRDRAEWRRPALFGAALLPTLAAGWAFAGYLTGTWLSAADFFFSGRFFYQYGFFMLPMPDLPDWWGAVVWCYLAGLTLGAWLFFFRRRSHFADAIVFLSVLGLGLFVYYQGRSHLFNLLPVMWPAALIFFLLAGAVVRSKKQTWKHRYLPCCAAALVLLGSGSVIFNAGRIGRGMATTFRGIRESGRLNPIEENTRFILDCAAGRREVNIYGYDQGIYYAESGLRAAVRNFCQEEIVSNARAEQIRADLLTSEAPLFLSLGPNVDFWVIEPVLSRYRVVARSPNRAMLYLENNAEPAPVAPVP